jgi:recombination protein RecT
MEENKDLVVLENDNKVSLRTQEGLIAVAQSYLKKNGDVVLPPNYDVNDAVKALYLKTIQTVDKQKRPVLEVCTRESIEQVVQKYVSQGLNISKDQCYIIPYGNTLTLLTSYHGKRKQAKTYAGVTINSDVIYEGEVVKISTRKDGVKIIEHQPDFTKFNLDKIIGAYAIAVNENGDIVASDIMTMQEIKRSWAKGQSGGDVHKQFPVEMCRKTVIGRLAKRFIDESDDSNKFDVIDSDMGGYYVNEGIDADIVIEDNKPISKPSSTNETEMSVDGLDEEKTKEIPYSEFKNNKTKYRAVPNSYNEETKTILVYC